MIFYKKVISVLLMVSMFSTFLVGCSTDEVVLIDALLKMDKVTSYESATDLSFNLDAGEEFLKTDATMNALISVINDSNIKINTKQIQNKENLSVKSEVYTLIDTNGLALSTGLWIDSDLSSEKPKFKEIIKIPKIATLSFPDNIKGKDYMFMDMLDMKDEIFKQYDYRKYQEFSEKIEKITTEFFTKYVPKMDPGFVVVTKKGSKLINNFNCDVYELRLSGKSFKELLKYTIKNVIQDENETELLRQLVVTFMEMYGSQGNININNEIKNVEYFFKNIKPLVPYILKNIDNIFNEFDNVNLIGKDGITIGYALNDNGHIVNKTGSISINIDSNKIFEALKKINTGMFPGDNGPGFAFKLKVNFNTNISNINQITEIKFPNLNEKNSFSINKLLEEQRKSIQSFQTNNDFMNNSPVTVRINNKYVTFREEPVIIDGRTFVPVRDIFENLGADVTWDSKGKFVTVVDNNTKIIFKINSKDVQINSEKHKIEVAPFINDGRMMVPLRFISENLGGYVNWNNETKIIDVNYQAH